MTATVVLNRASRARWLARRRKGITASDVPAILGLSPWATQLDVWLAKVSPEPEERAYRYDRGHALERPLADEYARTRHAIIERPPMLIAHPDHPMLLASLDWMAHLVDARESVALECKTSNQWEEWADNDLPDMYVAQALMQAAITGHDVVVFADVNGRLEERRVPRDPDWEADVIPTLLAWWDDYVVTRTPPPLHEFRDYPLLNRVWRVEPGEEIEATDAVMGAVNAYVALRERAKEREKTMTGLKTQVRAHMGTAGVLTHPDTGRKVASVTASGALLINHKPEPTTTEETAA